jgi:hypothetical protein
MPQKYGLLSKLANFASFDNKSFIHQDAPFFVRL